MRTHSICGLMILAMGLSGCEGNGGPGGVVSLSGGIYETREEIPTSLGSVTDYELVDMNGDRIGLTPRDDVIHKFDAQGLRI